MYMYLVSFAPLTVGVVIQTTSPHAKMEESWLSAMHVWYQLSSIAILNPEDPIEEEPLNHLHAPHPSTCRLQLAPLTSPTTPFTETAIDSHPS
jgi:hypothetical protein